MHNLDAKHPTRPGFEPSTSEFRATTGSNEPVIDGVRIAQCGALREINVDTLVSTLLLDEAAINVIA